jgi:hypothetical protein
MNQRQTPVPQRLLAILKMIVVRSGSREDFFYLLIEGTATWSSHHSQQEACYDDPIQPYTSTSKGTK